MWRTARPPCALVLEDASTGILSRELQELVGDSTRIDPGSFRTSSFNIVAELPLDEDVSVSMELSGSQTAANTSVRRPFSLYGAGGGSGLVAGSYTVTATVYRADGTPWNIERRAFTVAPMASGSGRAVEALTLLDPGDDWVLGAVASDAEVALDAGGDGDNGSVVLLRARTSGHESIGSVKFSVTGAATISQTATVAPFTMRATLPVGDLQR